MPRPPRAAAGGLVYHVLNRANARSTIFFGDGDYSAFLAILKAARERHPVRILSYCLMHNHWHMVLWPHNDGDLPRFMAWLTMTHAQRWHAAHHTTGQGHLYQGRYKSFPVQNDYHFHVVCRYVEGNPVRSRLVVQGRDWQWSSLWLRTQGPPQDRALLSEWPLPCPANWDELVNDLRPVPESGALNASILRSCPFGDPNYVSRSARLLGLESALRPRGRPGKPGKGS